MNWEQAKQQIAERRNFPDWEFMTAAYEGLGVHVGEEKYNQMVEKAYQESAELLANKSVIEDRETMLAKIPHVSKTFKRIFEESVLLLPYPFPTK